MSFASPLHIADQDGVLTDGGQNFRGYIITRAFPPSGFVNVLGLVRESFLVAKAADNTFLQMQVLRDFGLSTPSSTVDLTPVDTETRVLRKFEDIREADIIDCQIRLGDPFSTNTYWVLDLCCLQQQTEGEE